MKDLSIAIKYSIPTMVLALALVIIVIANAILNSSMEKRADTFPKDFMQAINVVLNADRDLYQARVAEIRIVYDDNGQLEQLKTDFDENAQQAKDRFNQFKKHMADYPDVIRQVANFDTLYNDWLSSAQKSISLQGASQSQQAKVQLNGESNDKFSALRQIYDKAGELSFEKANLLRDQIRDQNFSAKTTMWILVAITMIVVCGFVIYGQKSMLARIYELTNRIAEIKSGGGDLTKKIHIKQGDELGLLAKEFNGFLDMLRGLIIGIGKDATNLDSTSSKLDKSADNTAKIVAQQLIASDTIVHSVNEMSLATKELSEIAQNTANETNRAMESTKKGVAVIGQSVGQIDSLFTSVEGASKSAKALADESNNISNVLDVIRGVAEQTNLLALNAAIEAARAGEQGRGFAVVADEVRALASKTQESTENIQNMIQSLQSGVSEVVSLIEDGFNKASSSVELSRETQTLLTECQSIVNTISAMSIQTAAATEQQSVVSDGINNNLQDLNAQTQSTKVEADHTKAAANELTTIASSISQGVNQFKV
ncbi:methyl-accepting chemotaxis protein [Paraglaciecola aquimarina]|uniref:Methyl-accepting chemotaxis protein n=1 Tax=Paraglaciecola algarum TaxID=3050085 RepID=A0ABS9D971_9ALTE|nr:methyl-accepting chemotaxis protein [Paraglaciecola sp. G1-23]MCF2949469.1 methyl-accepting chemotaxis protein [Paraglaciecola sp. G1-23]